MLLIFEVEKNYNLKKMKDTSDIYSSKLKPYQFTILVPVYNEQENLIRLEEALNQFLEVAIISTNILFVNDGSTDDSESIIEEICRRNLDFNFISLSKNQGLSFAIKAGIDVVETSYIGYIDADLQTSPLDFNILLKYIGSYELITGVRENRKDSFVKKMSSTIANVIRRFFTNDGIDDTGCPLKVIRTDFAKRIPMFKGLHRFLPAMILLQNGRVKQIPIQHFPRIAGQPKYGLWDRFFGPFLDCFAYLWMKKRYINYTVSKSSNE